MTTNYIRTWSEKVKKVVLGSHDSRIVSIESGGKNKEPFPGFIQLFTSKMAMALKRTATVGNHKHTIPLIVWLTKKAIVDRPLKGACDISTSMM